MEDRKNRDVRKTDNDTIVSQQRLTFCKLSIAFL